MRSKRSRVASDGHRSTIPDGFMRDGRNEVELSTILGEMKKTIVSKHSGGNSGWLNTRHAAGARPGRGV